MRRTASLAVLTLATLLAAPSARAGECKVEVGPRDRVAKGESLVIRSGERVENAVVLQGDLAIEGGAVVEKAVAVGGTVTRRTGSQVNQDAVALGGDVIVETGARIGKDAVSLGGQVIQAKGAKIDGSVVGLAIQAGKSSLAREILKGITSVDDCNIQLKPSAGG